MPDNYVYDGEVYPDHLAATMLNHPGIPEDLRTEFKQALQAPEKPADALKQDEGAPPTTRIVVHPEASYDTSLSPEQETAYGNKFSPEASRDYDMRGWFLQNPDQEANAEGVHYPDTFKKPNHITFSDQSQYSTEATPGGSWATNPDKSYTFTPSAYNLQQHPAEEMKQYFNEYEKGNTLKLPDEKNFFQRLSIVNAVKGMANPSTDEDKAMLSGIYEAAKKGFNLLSAPPWALDQTTGEFHTSPEAIERAADLAGFMTLGPAPVAGKLADGTLGSFAGVRSNAFNVPNSPLKTRLYEAQNMELDKAHPEAIFNRTGFFRGAEGRWRYEINDQKAALKESAFQKNTIIDDPRTGGEVNTTFTLKENPKDFFGRRKVVTLDQVLDHPELYKAYPELARVKVEELPKQFVDKNIKGMISGDTLYLAPDLNPGYARSVILHEVQHKIQEAEGFARGGSASEFITPALEKAEQDYKQARQESLSNTKIPDPEMWIQAIKEHLTEGHPQAKELSIEMGRLKSMFPEEFEKLTTIAKSDTLLREARQEALVKYKRLAGEAEARNVQKRMDLSAYERSMSYPVSTEDTPRWLQQRLAIGERLPSNSEGEVSVMRRAANDNLTPEARKAARREESDKAMEKLYKIREEVDKKIASRPRRKELSDQKAAMRDILEKRDWNELELARYNKLDKEYHELLGLPFTPQK